MGKVSDVYRYSSSDNQHGVRGGATLHNVATQDGNGFMSSGDKTKLDVSSAVTRITSGPYTVLASDHTVFVDTDTGNVTVDLPAGVTGTSYRIINTGSAANSVTVSPNGSDSILGSNSTIALLDGDVVVLTFEQTAGWW